MDLSPQEKILQSVILTNSVVTRIAPNQISVISTVDLGFLNNVILFQIDNVMIISEKFVRVACRNLLTSITDLLEDELKNFSTQKKCRYGDFSKYQQVMLCPDINQCSKYFCVYVENTKEYFDNIPVPNLYNVVETCNLNYKNQITKAYCFIENFQWNNVPCLQLIDVCTGYRFAGKGIMTTLLSSIFKHISDILNIPVLLTVDFLNPGFSNVVRLYAKLGFTTDVKAVLSPQLATGQACQMVRLPQAPVPSNKVINDIAEYTQNILDEIQKHICHTQLHFPGELLTGLRQYLNQPTEWGGSLVIKEINDTVAVMGFPLETQVQGFPSHVYLPKGSPTIVASFHVHPETVYPSNVWAAPLSGADFKLFFSDLSLSSQHIFIVCASEAFYFLSYTPEYIALCQTLPSDILTNFQNELSERLNLYAIETNRYWMYLPGSQSQAPTPGIPIEDERLILNQERLNYLVTYQKLMDGLELQTVAPHLATIFPGIPPEQALKTPITRFKILLKNEVDTGFDWIIKTPPVSCPLPIAKDATQLAASQAVAMNTARLSGLPIVQSHIPKPTDKIKWYDSSIKLPFDQQEVYLTHLLEDVQDVLSEDKQQQKRVLEEALFLYSQKQTSDFTSLREIIRQNISDLYDEGITDQLVV